MSDKNIQMTQRNATNDGWDNLYPKTKASNVMTNSGSDVETQLAQNTTFETATGTATGITLTLPTLTNGYAKTFIASANNNGSATTINGIPLYKPSTTTAPKLISGKAYTIWYNLSGNCFFIKASATGTVTSDKVLAGEGYSTEEDTDLVGTMPNRAGDTVCLSSSISGTTLKLRASTGYRDGIDDNVTITDADFVASNILSGKNIFGLTGTLALGKKWATGTVTSASSSIQFYLDGGGTSNCAYIDTYWYLDFTPRVIVVRNANGELYDNPTIYHPNINGSNDDGDIIIVDKYRFRTTGNVIIDTIQLRIPVYLLSTNYTWEAYE